MASKYDTALIQIRHSYIGSEDMLYHRLPNTEISESNPFIFSNYFNGKIFNLQYWVSFALHQQESVTSTHVFPHPESSSHLTPQTIVLCCSRALALGALHHAMNLHQLSGCPASCTELAPVICLCMVTYMFQCCSLKSSHPCPLHRVQKSVLSISASFAALRVESSWPSLHIACICIPTQK